MQTQPAASPLVRLLSPAMTCMQRFTAHLQCLPHYRCAHQANSCTVEIRFRCRAWIQWRIRTVSSARLLSAAGFGTAHFDRPPRTKAGTPSMLPARHPHGHRLDVEASATVWLYSVAPHRSRERTLSEAARRWPPAAQLPCIRDVVSFRAGGSGRANPARASWVCSEITNSRVPWPT